MKKMKIRELKPKVKLIRELSEKTEGDKEIAQLTQKEIVVEQPRAAMSGTEDFVPREVSVTRPVIQDVARTARTQEVSPEQQPTRHLYDVGKSMSGEARVSYRAPESIAETGVRHASVGKDFAINQNRIDYPEANRIETSLRAADEEKKYESSNVSTAGGKRSKRYAWEA